VAANGGGAGGRNGLGVADADATASAQAELLATANELYQRMDASGGGLRPNGAFGQRYQRTFATLYEQPPSQEGENVVDDRRERVRLEGQ